MAKSSSSPDTPDYLGAALAQGQLSKEAALSQTGLSRPNEVTPWGSRTWSYTPRTSVSTPTSPATNNGGWSNPLFPDKPTAQPAIPMPNTGRPIIWSEQGAPGATGGRVMASGGGSTPLIQQGPTPSNLDAQMSVTPSAGGYKNDPIREAARNAAAEAASRESFNAYDELLKRSNSSIVNPGDWTTTTTLAPDQQKILDQGNAYKIASGGLASDALTNFKKQGGLNFTSPDLGQVSLQTKDLQRMGDPNVGLDQLGYNQSNFSQDRARVEDATYNRAQRLLDPQFSQQENSMRSRLANMGLDENSEQYRTQMGNFDQSRNLAYQDAADRAVLAGGNEQSRMLSDLLAARNQDLQSQQASFGADMAVNQANNAATQQEFAQDAQAQSTNFQAGLQRLQTMLGARGQALNEAQALSSGSTVTPPQFGGFAAGSGYQAPDIMGATQNQYNAALGASNAQNAAQNQGVSNAAQLGLMLAMFSDRRLKSNIVKIGKGFRDLAVYTYNIFGRKETGYLAQEVQQVMPEAVHEHESGFLMVNYAMLGGRP